MRKSGKHRSQEVGKINKKVRQRANRNKKNKKISPTSVKDLERLMKQQGLV